MLSPDEMQLYNRQLIFLGEDFQERLKSSSIAIVGLGGLGSPVAYYLVAAGIGRIKLIDKDKVSLSNLNRQILYTVEDIGKYKVDVAYEKLRKLNPYIKLEKYPMKVTKDSADYLFNDVDLILDCTDGWKNKILLAEISYQLNKPLIHAGIKKFYGQLFFMIPGKTACLKCILPRGEEEIPIPIIGVTAGMLGIIQATEAIKFLGGLDSNIIGKLVIVDLLDLSIDVIEVEKDNKCECY